MYTVSRDGAVFVWRAKPSDHTSSDDEDQQLVASTSQDSLVAHIRWGIHQRHYFNQHNTKVVCSTFHRASGLLIVGFSSGVFGLWEMPAFTNVHTLSISQEKISSVAINPSGEWLAFGARKLGQLLVWEWQSESYILKQQGHFYDVNTLAYSPDGQYVATGGDDGKVKLWDTRSGFCIITFSQHTASVSAVEFASQGQVLFSASLDGTVRAFDLIRYRNFRTFTSPSPVQFSCLAVDPSGEVITAGSTDSFEVFLWSVQTGKLLDVLAGHEGPVSSLAFSPSTNVLASGSWDKTVRVWDAFARSHAVEPFQLNSDVLSLAFRPDGQELVVSTLDGQLTFFSTSQSKQTNVIEGRKDISGGRKADDRVAASNSASSKAFTSVAWSADGSCVLAGGNSKYVALYDSREGVLIRRWQISQNLSLDGTEEFLDSRRVTEAGNIDLIDDRGEESDLEDRMDISLPGVQRGDLSKRRYKPEARTKCIRFSPTGLAWAAASTEGLLIYSVDGGLSFDPFDLSVELTPQSVLETLQKQSYLEALVMAFRLNEKTIINGVYEAIPYNEIRLVARQLPTVYVPRLLGVSAEVLERGPRLEWGLRWIREVLNSHGRWVRERNVELASVLREVKRAVSAFEGIVAKLYVFHMSLEFFGLTRFDLRFARCDENTATLSYLIDQSRAREDTEDAEDRMMVE